MSTPCCQILTPNRLVVSEYEVPKVLVSRKWWVFIETPGSILCTYSTSRPSTVQYSAVEWKSSSLLIAIICKPMPIVPE